MAHYIIVNKDGQNITNAVTLAVKNERYAVIDANGKDITSEVKFARLTKREYNNINTTI